MTNRLVDLDSLTEEQQMKLLRALRDTQVTLKFNGQDVAEWKRHAKATNTSLTRMIEKLMNKEVGR
jgi:Mor family transcriptional regulator